LIVHKIGDAKMRITYDSQADAIFIVLKEFRGEAPSSEQIAPNMIVRFDDQQKPISIELLSVSDYITDPAKVNFVDLIQQAALADKR
jgi:uncharacterized protein YuzE